MHNTIFIPAGVRDSIILSFMRAGLTDRFMQPRKDLLLNDRYISRRVKIHFLLLFHPPALLRSHCGFRWNVPRIHYCEWRAINSMRRRICIAIPLPEAELSTGDSSIFSCFSANNERGRRSMKFCIFLALC